MKRQILVLLLLLALLVQPAMAVNDTASAEHTIDLPGAVITFTSPEGLLCLTRETSASVFNRWGMSQREMFRYMEESNAYALIYDLETGAIYQIEIYPFDDSMDYDYADDTQMHLLGAETLKDMQRNGYTVKMVDTYRSVHHVYGMVEADYTYEDGYVESAFRLYTCRAGYEVDIFAWPDEGAVTVEIRDTVKRMADSLIITHKPPDVTTDETPEGQIILRRGDVKLTITPIDIRYYVTRGSGRYLFSRLNFDRDLTLANMERNDNYAIILDSRRTVEANVFLLDSYGAQPYADMMDWLRLAREKNLLSTYGWTIKRAAVFTDARLPFVKALVCRMLEDGAEQWRLVYACDMDGWRLEIAAIGSGEKTLTAAEEELDAFIRTIQYEEIRE